MTDMERGARSARELQETVVEIAVRLALLGALVYWSFQIIGPFVMVAVWGVILAVAIYPIYSWLEAQLGGRGTLASVLVTLLGLVIVIGPAAALAISAIESLQALSTGLRDGTLVMPLPPESVRDWPLIGGNLYDFWHLAATNLTSLIGRYSSSIVSAGRSILGGVAGFGGSVISLVVAIVVSGFLFGHAPVLTKTARKFAQRTVGDRGNSFVNLAGTTIRNVSRGVIGISLTQAILAGVVMMFAGVPGAGLLAVGVLVVCIIQIGPALLTVPVTIWVWMTMDTITALVFTVFIVPITIMDNFLKPIVMARGLETPMLVIFLGVLGGTLTQGLVGLFLGPIILAVFYELVVAWMNPDIPNSGTGGAKDA